MGTLISRTLLTSLFLAYTPSWTIAEDSGGKHRLDLSFTAVDAAEGDAYTMLPGYTLTFSNGLRLGLTTSLTYLETETDDDRDHAYDFGVGDSNIVLQYDPSQTITSSPWIPDTIGLTGSLTMPTGDADKGLGRDVWAAALGLGWAYPVGENFFLTPSAQYEWSFREESLGVETEFAWLSVGFFWVTPLGFWIGYTPYFGRDLILDEWTEDHALVIGKIWNNRFGISLDYGKVDRVDDLARRDDWATVLNFYFQFGEPH